jgi:hypothetical protein
MPRPRLRLRSKLKPKLRLRLRHKLCQQAVNNHYKYSSNQQFLSHHPRSCLLVLDL